ncbi:MAG: branched-chain amino acid ABC transporter permease [Deltaproteobacteria bacterium]|nr:branched-chain amino acid ABC transporter permease [Deltaproteobacteria bacterium]MBW2043684.1 branched-chain amino acid ABC transporter permease [Deltaproteobacteria bacterium]MBW2299825.1 branched-chain amino acid ABC transporter permease [Deltaproteobacteria bacterium]
MDKLSRYLRGPLTLVVLIVIARYFFPNKMTFLVEITTFSIYIIANDILYGYMGMVSFGQPFYLGVGAYASAIYLAHIGNNILVAIALALLMGLIAGLILGPAFIRLRGDYFALINAATCAMGLFLVEKILYPITRGDDGLWYRSRMHATPLLDLRKPDQFFWFAMIVLFVVMIWYTWLDRSAMGASFRAIKVNENKMKFLGYDTFKIRWTGYTLMCILAALAGSMYAINYGFVNPSITEPARAAEVLVATLLGGAGSVYGPFFGTFAFLGLKDLVSTFVSRWELAVGVLTIIVCFKFSGGVWGTIQTIGAKIRSRGKASAQSAT